VKVGHRFHTRLGRSSWRLINREVGKRRWAFGHEIAFNIIVIWIWSPYTPDDAKPNQTPMIIL
jgi:hypothetical protein